MLVSEGLAENPSRRISARGSMPLSNYTGEDTEPELNNLKEMT